MWKHQKCFTFQSGGATGDFSKNTPNNNYLPVQLIFTNSAPIDSARQAEECETSKSFQILGYGSNWGIFKQKNAQQ
jgi:hypothetical protein